jgi:hypothetical protein
MIILALRVSIAVLLFATGMSVTLKDVAWLWRRPVLPRIAWCSGSAGR